MNLENPGALWLLLALPLLLFGLWLLGWKTRREAVEVLHLDARRLRAQLLEKYILAGVFMACLVIALAMPQVSAVAVEAPARAGEVALLVDVSGSMAAQVDVDSLNRLQRAKLILNEIVDDLEEYGEVRVSLHGISSIARSHVPFVGREDYPYLRESIKRVVGINSVPGRGTSLGRPILNVVDKFSEDEQAKLVILLSDGEVFVGETRGINQIERDWIEEAVQRATDRGVKVITVGVGEAEGAKLPLTDQSGYIGEYAQQDGEDFVSYLQVAGMEEVASRTGGEYFAESDSDALMEYVEANLRSVSRVGMAEETRVYRSIAPWFLLAALPALVAFARRHLLA